MADAQGSSPAASAKTDFEAVIVGAGFSGMYMLHSLRDKLDMNGSAPPATTFVSTIVLIRIDPAQLPRRGGPFHDASGEQRC
jgi:NADH dehydrogenase FAD-containing subunit